MPKRALVIEGGGMKAAYANGVLSEFEEAGYRPWDAVYGTSAGGALAAWYSAGQARFAELTWNYAADRRIISYRRWITGRGPVLDHDFLIDEVYGNEHALDIATLRTSPHPVVVTASDVATGTAHYQDLRQGNVLAWLKATGRLPFASGPAVEIGGRLYLDGGITDPLPARKAVQDGHTDLVVITNNPPGPGKRENPALAAATARRFPTLRDGLLRHNEKKQEALAYVLAPPEGVAVHLIRPATPTGLHRLTRNPDVIKGGLARGHADGRAFLDNEA